MAIKDISTTIFTILLGVMYLRNAYFLLVLNKNLLPFPMTFGLFIIQLIRGKEFSNRRRAEFTDPGEIKRIGIYSLIGGLIFFITGIFMLVILIFRFFF